MTKVTKENGGKNDKMGFCENHNSFAPLQHTPAIGGHHHRLEDDNYILHYGPSKIRYYAFHPILPQLHYLLCQMV